MLRFVGVRLFSLIPVLVGASIFAFALAHVAPGDVTSVLLGPYASQQDRAALQHELALDKPLPVQYVRWLGNAVQGDLGTSVQLQQPVTTVLWSKFKNTLLLGLATFAVAFVIGVGAGFVSALRGGTVVDRSVQGATAFFAYVPIFLLGVVLIYIFAVRLKVLPAGGMGPVAGGGGPGDARASRSSGRRDRGHPRCDHRAKLAHGRKDRTRR